MLFRSAELKVYSDVIEEDVYPVLQLEYLVNKRDILGGTGIKPVLEALANAKASFIK